MKCPNGVSAGRTFLQNLTKLLPMVNSMRTKVEINDIEDFVFGMIWQEYQRRCIAYNLEYAQKHAEKLTPKDLLDLSSILLEVFLVNASKIRQQIEEKIKQLTETSES